MIHKILYFSTVFLIASCTLSHESNIQILTANKIVDITNPDFKICEKFQLTKSEITLYFQVAEQISNEEEHGESFILPCKYEGKLTLNKRIYSYDIYAGGSGYIYDKNGWVMKNFICKNDNCCSAFSNLC
jgi:hypothetical protein